MGWIWEDCWGSAVLIFRAVQSELGVPPTKAAKVSDLIWPKDGVCGGVACGRARTSRGHVVLLNNQLGWSYLLGTGTCWWED